MPILSFTPADALQTTVVAAGIYPCQIVNIKEQPSKEKTSIHYYTDFEISGGKYKGKTLTVSFNTNTKAKSLLGDMQFFPPSSYLEIKAAIENTKVEPGFTNLEINDLKHQDFCIAVGVTTVEGKIINTINSFYPVGADNVDVPF